MQKNISRRHARNLNTTQAQIKRIAAARRIAREQQRATMRRNILAELRKNPRPSMPVDVFGMYERRVTTTMSDQERIAVAHNVLLMVLKVIRAIKDPAERLLVQVQSVQVFAAVGKPEQLQRMIERIDPSLAKEESSSEQVHRRSDEDLRLAAADLGIDLSGFESSSAA